MMTEEITRLIKELYAAGEVGLIIALTFLIITIIVAGIILYLQRESLRQLRTISQATDSQIRLTDSQIKLLDTKIQSTNSLIQSTSTLREESKITVEFVKDQLQVVTSTNEDLRRELLRIRDEQEKISLGQAQLTDSQSQLRTWVHESLTAGIEDMRTRIGEITVQDILGQIPQQFRDDMEKQLSISAESVIKHILTDIKHASAEIIDTELIDVIAEKLLVPVLARMMDRLEESLRRCERQVDYLSARFENLIERDGHRWR